MHQTFDDNFLPPVTLEIVRPKILPGMYPWLRFGEFFTGDDWVEVFGINLEQVDEKAANAYLAGERAFFRNFDDCAPAIGQQRAIALKQTKLERIRGQFNHAASHLCRSPIEQLMLAALPWVGYGYEKRLPEIWDATSQAEKTQSNVVIAPQYQIGKHRVDFAIFINFVANEQIRIVVECDGHDFHEKNKEQAARDKRRDRDVEIAGWKALRFTGSEIWRDHKACASHVAELATNEIEAQLKRRGLVN
jgi:very-short-patch-repair endonuclease